MNLLNITMQLPMQVQEISTLDDVREVLEALEKEAWLVGDTDIALLYEKMLMVIPDEDYQQLKDKADDFQSECEDLQWDVKTLEEAKLALEDDLQEAQTRIEQLADQLKAVFLVEPKNEESKDI